MARQIRQTTPKEDGYRMPAEYEPQKQVWMIWPQRPDVWRDGAKPAQKQYKNVAIAISEFTPVTVVVNGDQYINCRAQLPESIRVIEVSNNDAWARDSGPTFLVNDKGGLRANSWQFNAYGGLVDGLYYPWDKDNLLADKICEVEGVDYYKQESFVLEGGSIHVDGEGTVLTTEMCLLSKGRNPNLSKGQIEQTLKDYLNVEKVIWIKDGIDPEETNGHVDDVACFARPGEVICIYTEDKNHPFYEASQAAYKTLCQSTDAKGRPLKVYKLCLTKEPVYSIPNAHIDYGYGSKPRQDKELVIASYLNFLITNQGVIVPQYDDENDALAIKQLQSIFPDKEVVGVRTKEIVYGGGNIHCITQQEPLVKK